MDLWSLDEASIRWLSSWTYPPRVWRGNLIRSYCYNNNDTLYADNVSWCDVFNMFIANPTTSSNPATCTANPYHLLHTSTANPTISSTPPQLTLPSPPHS
ncbi:hypothetical protein M8J77_025577 [Diaphorina citri]|nr:hypothetical protein M8J77_025577 [Diaphorina citri]